MRREFKPNLGHDDEISKGSKQASTFFWVLHICRFLSSCTTPGLHETLILLLLPVLQKFIQFSFFNLPRNQIELTLTRAIWPWKRTFFSIKWLPTRYPLHPTSFCAPGKLARWLRSQPTKRLLLTTFITGEGARGEGGRARFISGQITQCKGALRR